VFPYVDRFARAMETGLATIRKFREAGAQVLFSEFGWVTDETHVKVLINIYLMVAEMQRDSIAEKSRLGVETKITKGFAHGGARHSDGTS
jgi:DNA invertase Pin-like site-specific DNA recombinase